MYAEFILVIYLNSFALISFILIVLAFLLVSGILCGSTNINCQIFFIAHKSSSFIEIMGFELLNIY